MAMKQSVRYLDKAPAFNFRMMRLLSLRQTSMARSVSFFFLSSFMRLAMTIEAVKYVIAKSQVNLLPVSKTHGDEAICSLFRQGTGIQLPNDEIAQPEADKHGAQCFIPFWSSFIRLAMTIWLESSTSK